MCLCQDCANFSEIVSIFLVENENDAKIEKNICLSWMIPLFFFWFRNA